MPAFTRADYETLLYTLPDRYPAVAAATLRLYTQSATTALVRGSVHFQNGLELRVFEYVDLTDGELLAYSYEIWRGADKIRWYDPQPHRDDPALAETFPHHYHTEPDIKHHRCPAPGLSFTAPNLPTLIAVCTQLK